MEFDVFTVKKVPIYPLYYEIDCKSCCSRIGIK